MATTRYATPVVPKTEGAEVAAVEPCSDKKGLVVPVCSARGSDGATSSAESGEPDTVGRARTPCADDEPD